MKERSIPWILSSSNSSFTAPTFTPTPRIALKPLQSRCTLGLIKGANVACKPSKIGQATTQVGSRSGAAPLKNRLYLRGIFCA
jgi:hypothetical protein